MFISESSIVEVGYSQGYDFVIWDTKQVYKGFYHKDKDNRYWTGEKHNENSILLKRNSSETNLTVDDLLKYDPISRGFTIKFNPTQNLSVPLLKGDYNPPKREDYNKGYFNRYIAQINLSKNPYIIELTKENFDFISRSSLYKVYYNSISLTWKLVGPLEDIYNNNIRIESGVKDTNLRSIQQAKKTIKDIELLLNNPLQFTYF